jgi:hypothetical protein
VQRFREGQRKSAILQGSPMPALPHYFADWLDFVLKMFRTTSSTSGLSYAAVWQI